MHYYTHTTNITLGWGFKFAENNHYAFTLAFLPLFHSSSPFRMCSSVLLEFEIKIWLLEFFLKLQVVSMETQHGFSNVSVLKLALAVLEGSFTEV